MAIGKEVLSMDNDSKLKHLEFIQEVINRMGSNSFYLKGWSVTLVAAIFVLATKDGNPNLVPVAFLPVVAFWFLDAYFLRQERLFRRLYDVIREQSPNDICFSMDTSDYEGEEHVCSYGSVMFSITLRWFHGALIAVIIAAQILTKVL